MAVNHLNLPKVDDISYKLIISPNEVFGDIMILESPPRPCRRPRQVILKMQYVND